VILPDALGYEVGDGGGDLAEVAATKCTHLVHDSRE
jgi:hypothetical protein